MTEDSKVTGIEYLWKDLEKENWLVEQAAMLSVLVCPAASMD